MIILKDITKKFTDGTTQRTVLDHLSLQVGEGDFIAITGESGSGKSTLLSILATMIQADEGTYVLNDTDITHEQDNLPMIRNKKVGMVFQDHRLLPQFTALQNILLPVLATEKAVPDALTERAERLMEFTGVLPLRDQFVDHLSGGEQTRIAICRALINQPSLLLADEPTGELDAANAHLIADLFRQINRELHTTIVMVTHSSEMAQVAHQVYHLQDGKLLAQSSQSSAAE